MRPTYQAYKMLRAYAWRTPLRLNVVNTRNKWNAYLLLPDKQVRREQNTVSTLARIHPKGTVPLILASTCTQVTPREPYDLWISERRFHSQHLLLITRPCCERATATLTKPETSEMKMMRGVAINIAETTTRNIWTEDHTGPTSHPGSILTDPHPLASWPSPRAGKSSLSGLYGSIATPSPSGTVQTCSQVTLAELSPGWEHWVPWGPKCLPVWSFAKLVDLWARAKTLDWSHTRPCFFILFPTSQQKFYTKVGVINLHAHDQYVEILLIYTEHSLSWVRRVTI